jgi:signal transduction histidine kinase
LILVHVSLVVVIGLSAATAVIALRSTREQAARSREIDHRVALLDGLRAQTRELALSARRYVLGGDMMEQQRVIAIVHAMKADREKLHARDTLAKGAILEADLEEYIAALDDAMSVDDDDAVTRLAQFEDQLVKIRGPLAMTFDDIISSERARRDTLRSAQTLATGAQWAVLIASVLGALLVIDAARVGLRRVDRSGMQTGIPALRRELCEATDLADQAVRTHRGTATERGVRMRCEAQRSVTVFADRDHIRHVLGSLLQLALAGARRGAELVIHVAAADGGVRFAIIEPGPGTDGTPANDLALYLSSRVVEAHGGRLGVQTSSISRTYWFSLPTEPSLLT